MARSGDVRRPPSKIKMALVVLILIGVLGTVLYTVPVAADFAGATPYNGGIIILLEVHGVMHVDSVTVTDYSGDNSFGQHVVPSRIVGVGKSAFTAFNIQYTDIPTTPSTLGFGTPVAVYAALPYTGVCNIAPTDSPSIDLYGTWGLLPIPVTVSLFVTPDMCS